MNGSMEGTNRAKRERERKKKANPREEKRREEKQIDLYIPPRSREASGSEKKKEQKGTPRNTRGVEDWRGEEGALVPPSSKALPPPVPLTQTHTHTLREAQQKQRRRPFVQGSFSAVRQAQSSRERAEEARPHGSDARTRSSVPQNAPPASSAQSRGP